MQKVTMRSVPLGLMLWILWLAAVGLAGAQAPAAPAKALLKIDKLPAEPLDAAVYDARAVELNRPLVSARGVGPAGVEIPAGELLVVLRSGRKAPDLHRLTVQPGAAARVEYRPREGWSLIVRTWNARTRQPVAAAVVSLGVAQENGAPSRPVGTETTGADGLALFSGVAGPVVDAGILQADYVPQTVPGLSAVPGGLAFRDVPLEDGGRVRASVRVKGQPQGGASCKLTSLQSPQTTPYEGRSDPQGICQTGHVPAGRYAVSVLLPGATAPWLREITLEDGQELREDFAFSEIRVHGTVTRGDNPVPGLRVEAVEQGVESGWDQAMAMAVTRPDGTYELTLPKAGPYDVGLLPAPKRPPALQRGVVLKEGEDTTVDFALRRVVIDGNILDGQGQPIAGAWVKLHWNDLPEMTQRTGSRGEFLFFLDSLGSGEVTAGKEGYLDAPVQDLELDDDDQFPPMVLVLEKERPQG